MRILRNFNSTFFYGTPLMAASENTLSIYPCILPTAICLTFPAPVPHEERKLT